MPRPEDFHCKGCEQHFYMHQGGKSLPCAWCEQHAREGSWWK
ncbi:hypothetical protein [Streptomyces sp. NPDC046925]